MPASANKAAVLDPHRVDPVTLQPITLDGEIAQLADYITLRDLAAQLPRRRGGKKTHVATVYRWASPHGCRGVVMRTTMIGCVRCTTLAWVNEFFERLTAARTVATARPADTGSTAPLTSRTPAARRKALAEAERELDAKKV